MESGQVAKTVILSSLVTTVVIVGLVYVFRAPLVAEVQQLAVANETQLLPLGDTEDRVSIYETQITDAIATANPAVVSVVVTKDVPVYERYLETYDGFFGNVAIPRTRQNGTEEREVGGGSGFIVSNDGMIVTNRHVVDDGEARYSVLLNDGTSHEVDVLARDPQLDIAILKISEPLEAALPFLRFGASESLELGQTVIAIGNALAEFRNSVSVGVVSGLARSIVASDSMGRSEQLDQVIQTDAAINPGNSGGPLLDVHGEVIGVNVATSRGADNIGFALPGYIVENVVSSVREYGEIVRPFLGVRYTMINEQIAENNNLPVTYGALVIPGPGGESAVQAGSPAAEVGIAVDTIILAIDGEELRDRDLATILRGKTVDETVSLELLQNGERRTVSATLSRNTTE